MSVQIEIQNISFDLPDRNLIAKWLNAALDAQQDVYVSIKVVDHEEMQSINHQYRQKDKPTNVLSFPSRQPPGLPIQHLGDIVICPSVVEFEALKQNKILEHHYAHLFIHAALHLLGYDHETLEEANAMEQLEIKILSEFNIANPYGVTNE